MNKRLTTIIAAIMLTLASMASAQDYRYEFGAGIGMSGYLGDANMNLLKHPGFGAGILWRYIPNYRFAIRANFQTAGLRGNTADYKDVLPGGVNYQFKSQVYDLGGQVEFNFFNFGLGYKYKNLHRLTPYITAGVGVVLSVCDGKKAVAPNIPVGIGVKFKLNERMNLGLEFTMRKVFGDKLDGYDIDDLKQIESSFICNTDWYSMLQFSFTYEFGKRCKVCHYVE